MLVKSLKSPVQSYHAGVTRLSKLRLSVSNSCLQYANNNPSYEVLALGAQLYVFYTYNRLCCSKTVAGRDHTKILKMYYYKREVMRIKIEDQI